jgi:hypothetical protein
MVTLDGCIQVRNVSWLNGNQYHLPSLYFAIRLNPSGVIHRMIAVVISLQWRVVMPFIFLDLDLLNKLEVHDFVASWIRSPVAWGFENREDLSRR